MTYHKRYRDAVNTALESLGVTGTYGDLILHALSEADDAHIVMVEENSFSIKHPISERLSEDLFECPLDVHMSSQSHAPVDVGKWKVIRPEGVEGGDPGWLFIPEGIGEDFDV